MSTIDKDATPKATPVLPSSRPSPSVLLALSADVNKRVSDAMKHLGEVMARIHKDAATAEDIRFAMNDLAVARTSCDAIAAECQKAVR